MSHSKDSQEIRNNRWQQRQREESQGHPNPRSSEPRTQGEHSGQQRNGHEMEDRSSDRDSRGSSQRNDGDAEQSGAYYNPRQPQESPNDSPKVRDDSNREWVSGTEDAPHNVNSGSDDGTNRSTAGRTATNDRTRELPKTSTRKRKTAK